MPTDTAKPKRPAVDRAKADSSASATRARIARSHAKLGKTDEAIQRSTAAVEASKATLKCPAGKLGAEKLTPEEQHRRFVEAARASGAIEDVADFNAIIRQIAKPKAG